MGRLRQNPRSPPVRRRRGTALPAFCIAHRHRPLLAAHCPGRGRFAYAAPAGACCFADTLSVSGLRGRASIWDAGATISTVQTIAAPMSSVCALLLPSQTVRYFIPSIEGDQMLRNVIPPGFGTLTGRVRPQARRFVQDAYGDVNDSQRSIAFELALNMPDAPHHGRRID